MTSQHGRSTTAHAVSLKPGVGSLGPLHVPDEASVLVQLGAQSRVLGAGHAGATQCQGQRGEQEVGGESGKACDQFIAFINSSLEPQPQHRHSVSRGTHGSCDSSPAALFMHVRVSEGSWGRHSILRGVFLNPHCSLGCSGTGKSRDRTQTSGSQGLGTDCLMGNGCSSRVMGMFWN